MRSVGIFGTIIHSGEATLRTGFTNCLNKIKIVPISKSQQNPFLIRALSSCSAADKMK